MFKNILSDFYLQLDVPRDLPPGVEVLDPYRQPQTQEIVRRFFSKYYDDQNRRILLVGINPGRFGAGVTGIGFTDPINLEKHCGIPNDLEKKAELSSEFMYQVIESMGGAKLFFRRFFFSSVSPLGFTKEGVNLNYYDIPELKNSLEPFMAAALQRQIELGGSAEVAFSIGMGQNVKYLHYLNAKYGLFKTIEALPHPRWVMQYRRKTKERYIKEYKEKLMPWLKK